MRAQSSSRSAFGLGPLESSDVRETNIEGHAQCSIPATLTEGPWRVWLRRRLYWLRCRIVNENSPKNPCPPAWTARPRPECDAGCGLRHAVARRRGRFLGAQARREHRRRPHDRAASFRLEGRAVAADRRPGAGDGRAAAAERRLARRSAQRRRFLPGSRPPAPTRVSSALPLSRNGSRRSCFERGGLPRAAGCRAFGRRGRRTWACVLRVHSRLRPGRGRRAVASDRRGGRSGVARLGPAGLFRDAGADPGVQGARSRGDVRNQRSPPSSTGCRAGARPARSADQAARNKATQPSLSISTSSKRCLKPSRKESRSSSRLLNTPLAL